MPTKQIRVKAGEEPPKTYEFQGETYRPKWIEITKQADRDKGEAVWEAELGDPVEPDSDDD